MAASFAEFMEKDENRSISTNEVKDGSDDYMKAANMTGAIVFGCTIGLGIIALLVAIRKARSRYREYVMGETQQHPSHLQEIITPYPSLPKSFFSISNSTADPNHDELHDLDFSMDEMGVDDRDTLRKIPFHSFEIEEEEEVENGVEEDDIVPATES